MEFITSLLQEGFIYIAACVLLLGILIFVHELGHFLVARWCGVRVEVFSLGFGKKLFKWVRGDTTYCISLIPLGGYVKMFGEQPGEEISASDRAVSFTHKTVWQRIAIVLAGPLMNFFFAVVVFAALSVMGQDARSPILGDIEAESEAYQLGFRSGDLVLEVGGHAVKTFDEISEKMNEGQGQELSFLLQGATGERREVRARIGSKDNPNPLSLDERIGDIPGFGAMAKASLVGILPKSPLGEMGLKTGDRITKVNDQEVRTFYELRDLIAKSDPQSPLELQVERGLEDPKKIEQLSVALAQRTPRDLRGLGLESTDLYLWKVVDGSPAKLAGLQSGDRLVSINGQALQKWEDVLNRVKTYSGDEGLQVEFVREGQAQTLKIVPQVTSQVSAFGTEDKRYTIGIVPMVMSAMPFLTTVRAEGPIDAVRSGFQMTWDWSVVGVLSIVRLIQAEISPKTIGGILSIGQAAGETMKMGFSKFLMMMGIISVHLFVLNLLPVPVLDGGHLVFYIIEVVKGSPLSLKKIEMAQQVGLVLLMGLMVFALFNDVTRIIFGRL